MADLAMNGMIPLRLDGEPLIVGVGSIVGLELYF